MEPQFLIWLVDGLLVLLAGVGGWFMRQLWDIVKRLQNELAALEVRIAKEYVPYDRLQDALKPIMDSLSEIKDTLRHKVDK